jgi:hypothetical protein
MMPTRKPYGVALLTAVSLLLTAAGAAPTLTVRPMSSSTWTYVDNRGSTAYFFTNAGAPRGSGTG